MNASEFTEQFDMLVTNELGKLGFVKKKKELFYKDNETILAILRVQNKFSNMLQHTAFVLCLRHSFLRDLDKDMPEDLLMNPNEYPFKVRISNLDKKFLKKWHYVPKNLGLSSSDYDEIYYGETMDASGFLKDITSRISTIGMEWAKYLTPQEALRQIKKFGEKAYCEKIWIEDYEKYLN